MVNIRLNNKCNKNEDYKKDILISKSSVNIKKKNIPPPSDDILNEDELSDSTLTSLPISLPSTKLDKEFMEKCYVYGLPFRWQEEYTNSGIEPKLKKKISKSYNKVKKNLISRSIQITDILKLENITNDERCKLLERYAIMQSLDGDLYEYLKYRDELHEAINYYKLRQISYEELIEIEKKKEILKKINLNSEEIEQRILKLNIDNYSQAQIYQKFMKLSSMGPMDSEFHKLKEWIDIVIDIPFTNIKPLTLENLYVEKKILPLTLINLGLQNKLIFENISVNSINSINSVNSVNSVNSINSINSVNSVNSINTINSILTQVKERLDIEIYGMESIKEELLLIINHRLCNPNSSDHSIALIGPPGVGKTKIVRTLASILNLPFEQISMGGINDGSFLDGHAYTYEGARPGKIVDALKKLGCKNGILFFDEIDKIGSSSRSQEVSNQLLHITDFTQNTHFCDKYLPELPLDLSKIWFIFSLNDEKLMDPILKNRMNLIKVSGYTSKDKIQIIDKFLIPQITESLGMDKSKIILTNEIKLFIINKCSQEEGIRDIKRAIEALYRKLDILCKAVLSDGTFGELKLSFAIKNFIFPYTINFQDINSLLKNYIVENKIPMGLYI